MKKKLIKIKGVHCVSCKILIETEINALPGVKNIKVDYKTGQCQLEFDESKISQKKIIAEIIKLNYKVSSLIDNRLVKTKPKKTNLFSKRLSTGFAIIIILFLGYYIIDRFGFLEIMAELNEESISYPLIFLIGILASFHCVGMCGGLVVTYSALNLKNKDLKQSKNKYNFIEHFEYNGARFLSYTVIGGILGGFGSFFAINPHFKGFVLMVAAVFMVLLGLSLFTDLRVLEKIKFRTPKFIAKFLYRNKHKDKPRGPFIIGLLTGFMPCGPLQAMQLYALASGNIIAGATSMGIYALGTVPVLFLFGGFISLISQEKIKQMMKISGVVVIILGLFMLNRGLINFGYGYRGFIPSQAESSINYKQIDKLEEYQTVRMNLTYSGYSPNVLYIKRGIPVQWIIDVKQMTGCTDEIILHGEYNIRKKLQSGENIIEFMPNKTGEIKFSCWMKMVWGKFIVTETDNNPTSKDIQKESLNLPQSGTCSGNGSCGGNCGQSTCGCGK